MSLYLNGHPLTSLFLAGNSKAAAWKNGVKVFQKSAPGPESMLLTPAMTSNTTPAPFSVLYSGFSGSGWPPWAVFDQGSKFWESQRNFNTTTGIGVAWVGIDLGPGASRTLTAYSLTNRPSGNLSYDYAKSPRDWTMEVSNDGENWLVVHAVNDEPESTAFNQKRDYVPHVLVGARYFRMHITANQISDAVCIGEIGLYGY
jgi:hypothetical protein